MSFTTVIVHRLFRRSSPPSPHCGSPPSSPKNHAPHLPPGRDEHRPPSASLGYQPPKHTHRSQAMEILEQPVLKTALLFHPGSSASVPFYLTPEILVGNHSRITALDSPLGFVGTRVRSGVKVWSALISPFGGSFSVRL